MEEIKVQFTREEEKEFVDYIIDCMHMKPVHVGIEFANFSIHFDGSDDRADQAWLIDKITDYMSEGTIIPCVVTMNDMGLTISNIHAAEYIDSYHPNVTTKNVDTMYFDNTNDEYEATVPEPTDTPPPEGPTYITDSDEPTFRTVMNALYDIFKSGDQKKKIGEYEIMVITPYNVVEPSSSYIKIQYRYIFGKSDKGTDGIHPSPIYLVFSTNIQADDVNNTLSLTDTDDYQLSITSLDESYTIPNIDISILTWASSTTYNNEMGEFINWLRIMCMNFPHTPLT